MKLNFIFILAVLAALTACETTVSDIDGNVYKTVKIGDQVWMAENLKVTHYRDGTALLNLTTEKLWDEKDNVGGYCYYNNDSSNADNHGALYNWAAINEELALAPEGWHVATDDEWKELELYLGMSQEKADEKNKSGFLVLAMNEEEKKEFYAFRRGRGVGSKLASHTNLWEDGELVTDLNFGSSGFSAIPSGYRSCRGSEFKGLGNVTYFWTATELDLVNGWTRKLNYDKSDVTRDNFNWCGGLSVRCVKDNVTGGSTSKKPQKVTEIDVSLLKKRNGIQYEGNSDKPFTGMVTSMYPNGQVSIEWIFKDGVRSGPQRSYFENGKLEAKIMYKGGEWNGLTKSWYENGQKKSEKNYKNAKLNGFAKTWFENGKMKAESIFRDGKLNGPSKMWYENGQMYVDMPYENGLGNGIITMWSKDGTISKQGRFERGKLVENIIGSGW